MIIWIIENGVLGIVILEEKVIKILRYYIIWVIDLY